MHDPWPMKDNYMDWSVDNIADWISYLNDAFIEYGDKCKEHNICGQDFHQLTEQSFWINKIGVDNEPHIKALCKAAKYRMEQYQIVKDGVIEEKKDMNKDNEENQDDNVDISKWIGFLNKELIEWGKSKQNHIKPDIEFYEYLKYSFWRNKKGVDDDKQIKALCEAAKHKLAQYEEIFGKEDLSDG